jgi:coenzyme F420-0:L-glutamate ligase/coenzyme F420-1:gamma-L-glutamate ligase
MIALSHKQDRQEDIALEIFGIQTPLVREGDDLVKLALDSSEKAGNRIRDRDIVIFSAKVVGTSQGRLVDLSKVKPSPGAVKIAIKHKLDPRFAQVILDEADSVLGGVDMALLTVKGGVLIANAGADQSNAPLGHAALWPEDPQYTAEQLRRAFRAMGMDVGVMVIDSRTMPLRMGSSAVALGVAGFAPVEDLRGRKDLFGRAMKIKRAALADELAAAANVVMGETSESVPVAVARGAPVRFEDGHSIEEAFIPVDQCLIMHMVVKSVETRGKRRTN